MARLPIPGSDDGRWGQILNEYLSQSHNPDGSIKSASINKAELGLDRVSNTSDYDKPISYATQSALNEKLNTDELDTNIANKIVDINSNTNAALQAYKGVPGGYATLDDDGKLEPEQWVNYKNTFIDVVRDHTVNGTQSIAPNNFRVISFPQSVTNTESLFDNSSNFYTVPSEGLYLCIINVRLEDETPSGISYGIGIHTSTAGYPTFQWQATSPEVPVSSTRRQAVSHQRLSLFSTGQQLRGVIYADNASLEIKAATLSIVRLM